MDGDDRGFTGCEIGEDGTIHAIWIDGHVQPIQSAEPRPSEEGASP